MKLLMEKNGKDDYSLKSECQLSENDRCIIRSMKPEMDNFAKLLCTGQKEFLEISVS